MFGSLDVRSSEFEVWRFGVRGLKFESSEFEVWSSKFECAGVWGFGVRSLKFGSLQIPYSTLDQRWVGGYL